MVAPRSQMTGPKSCACVPRMLPPKLRCPGIQSTCGEPQTTELRRQLGVPKREDLTLKLCLDVIREDREMDPAAGGQNKS
jgi:hypothetical protein